MKEGLKTFSTIYASKPKLERLLPTWPWKFWQRKMLWN